MSRLKSKSRAGYEQDSRWDVLPNQTSPSAENLDQRQDVRTGDALAQLGRYQPTGFETELLLDGLGLDIFAHRSSPLGCGA